MTFFSTVKAALDSLIAGICAHRGVSRDVALQMAGTHLKNMSVEWRSGRTPTIAYGDPLCRFAYLYCHTPANANICDLFIRSDPATAAFIVERLNRAEELRVCAFGGGPGTELLALTKFLRRAHGKDAITAHGEVVFTLLDNVPEWVESWGALETAIKADFARDYGVRRAWPFTISKSFQPFDMTHVEQYANLNQLLIQDLYILNYVVSEILGENAPLQGLINLMVDHAPMGGRFVIIDRDQDGISDRAETLLRNAGLTLTPIQKSTTNMDGDEQMADLGDYLNSIGWSPRVKWNGAFCVIGTKS